MINCLIVDDEPIARTGMLEHVQQIGYLNPVASCKSAMEAMPFLSSGQIDLVFLDIQMPQLTGIELVRALVHPPLVVFTTAYPEYALEGYELDVVDYLLKPVSFPRLLKAADKARRMTQMKEELPAATRDYFFIRCNGRIEKIVLSELCYVEAASNYVIIHTRNQKYVTYLTFGGVAERLPAAQFLRIHKSFLVAFDAIQSIEGAQLKIGNAMLPVSKAYRPEVMARIEERMLRR